MKSALFALTAILLAGTSAVAEDTAPPVNDWKMEVVVVEADQKGPPLWHIKKGDSEVFILGTVGMMPKDIAFNKAELEKVVDGADQVLLPPQARTGFFGAAEMGWFLITHWGSLSMPDGKKLEPSLQADLRARFVAAREELGLKADKFEDRKPLIAGFMLLGQFAKKNNLEGEIPERAVEKIADGKHVKVSRVAEYDAMPLVQDMLKLGPAENLVCFESTLKDYETSKVHALAAADAWAVGDVAGIKAHYSTPSAESCVKQSQKYGALDRRAVNDMLSALHAALAKPGKTVMVIDVGWMFRSQGVAEQLVKEGVVIEGPAK